MADRKTVLLTAEQVSVVRSDRNRLKIAMHQQYICLHLIFKTNMPLGACYLTLTEHERWAWKWQLLCTLYQAQGREYSCHIWLMSKINVFTTNFSHHLLCSYKRMWGSVWVLHWGQEWLRKKENKSCLYVGLSNIKQLINVVFHPKSLLRNSIFCCCCCSFFLRC